jgi:uncharacterized protein YwqG
VSEPIDMAAFRARLVERNLERHAEALVALAEPSIRLVPQAAAASQPLGATKLGGAPDLPPGVEWPAFQGVPHSFIAQINLAEMSGLDGAERLPSAGLLSFFYDAEQRIWGFDPADREGWRVLYSSSTEAIQPRTFPHELPSHARFRARRLRPRVETTLAAWESSDVLALVDEYPAALEYAQALPPAGGRGPRHRLLGHPDSLQGDMQRESQLAANGIYCGDARAADDPRVRELLTDSRAWRLLLQIDTDDEAGMMWGDCGSIYYWMRREDLAAAQFDRAWCVLQCA